MLSLVDLTGPILQTGAVGAMMVMVWRLMVKKDKKSYEMIKEHNEERKEMYKAHTELIQEVTVALTDKNHTDDKMAAAITKLAEEFSDLKQERNNETT
jgi:hypothetical protein